MGEPIRDPGEVRLRETRQNDLPAFFSQQLDPDANHMAAFIRKNHTDRDLFMAHWQKITKDNGVYVQTILLNDRIAGYVLCHDWFGDPEVGYWIGKEFWGRGVATRALKLFLGQVKTRPLYAHAAKDNLGSLRVLEKCGFRVSGEGTSYSNARGEDVEEYILLLEH
ncbi:MAG: GNAT family N-acetyltransferase [Anaerolineales bacterium]|nr:GNAT family N-acetyltransferase [Anaerolineales bacterium]